VSTAATTLIGAGSGIADPVEQAARFPTTLAQQRFWVLDRLDPGNPALNVAVRWRLEGELSVAVIEQAFKFIIARHAPLRTAFIEADGEPVQVVHPSVYFRAPSVDLTVLADEDAQAECERIGRAEARRSFDLAIAPLIRVTHVQVRPDAAILLVTTHHSVCDGWSIGLIARELGAICEALRAGKSPDLAELPLSYGDFACWQREFVAAEGLRKEVEFWSRRLDGMGYFELESDHPRRSAQPTAGSIRSVLLDRRLSDALGAVAREHGCTLFMVVLASLLSLLHRYTGAEDIILGTQVAGREFVEVENLVGLFINTIVLRTDVSGDPTFADLLGRVRTVVADALEHEAIPLEKIIEVLKPKRYPGYNAVLSTNFIFQRSFVDNADYGKFRLIDIPSYSAGAMYDLNFFMVERPEGWRASCEFNTALYDATTVDRLLRHFCNVLAAVVADPSLRVSRIPVLDEAERRQLLFARNPVAAEYPRQLTLPQLFNRQARQTPEATAIVDGARRLSYQEVEQRSNALAARLLGDVGPGARIGVFVRRSANLVIAPLAVMKAGSAYVPLDPAYPAGRLAQIIEQSDMAAIIADSSEPALPDTSKPVITIEEEIDDGDSDSLPVPLPDDTAYIMFTSGSTGQPKGVQIPHGALTNFLCAMRDRPGFGAEDSIVALTTICFDISILELFLPLTVGAAVVIADEETTRDGRLLLSLIQRSGVRVLQATPTTWRLLLDAGWDGSPRLRMLSGGEPLPTDLARQLLARGPELWNMYGPTETTIWSAAQRIGADATVTIGAPIANTQFYVVDRYDEPVPEGAVGELLIGGDGVAAGYWEMPEMTRERFIPDKFRNLPGKRLYRTGDMVRMRRDGAWEFLGRRDSQVKIRGYRIELSEVEAVLLRHADVRNAVAVVGEGASDEPAIFAYAELSGGGMERHERVVDELRSLIAYALPAYMRPAALVAVETIPRLPNGKIDRKALHRSIPKPSRPDPKPQPASEIESRLRDVWCSVLGVETVEDSDDFFDLGGHSLVAARLLARVETAFGCRINLSALFDAPSFGAFKKLVEVREHREFDFRQVVRFQPRSEASGIFAINNTGIYLTLSRRLTGALPLTALQLFDPAFPTGPLPTTLEEIAHQYIELLQRLQPTGPYAFLGWCNGGVLAFEIARQLQEAGHIVSRVMVVDTWLPGYSRSQGRLRSWLANWSYRSKLVLTDWSEVRAGRKALRTFLADRKTLRRLLLIPKSEDAADHTFAAAEQYDRWLVTYLNRVIEAYRPRRFDGNMTVFRSAQEPAGLFLDPKLGWDGYASRGVDLVVVPGDHYTAFQGPGVSVMARHIEATVGVQHAEFARSSEQRPEKSREFAVAELQ
jgi:amino acid adenylation domain-containing protein